jgi:hypothetical protein
VPMIPTVAADPAPDMPAIARYAMPAEFLSALEVASTSLLEDSFREFTRQGSRLALAVRQVLNVRRIERGATPASPVYQPPRDGRANPGPRRPHSDDRGNPAGPSRKTE